MPTRPPRSHPPAEGEDAPGQAEARKRIEQARREGSPILDLRDLQLTSVPEALWQLTTLQWLELSGNQLTSVPEALGQLIALQRLDLSRNQLTSVPAALGQLTALQGLNLSGNKLTSVPEALGHLAEAGTLRELFLHGNETLGIPPEILGPDLDQVYSMENRRLPEAQRLKAQSPRRIARYLRQLQAGPVRPLNEAKVLVVGPGGHGKSSLIEYLRDGTFQKGKKTTEGIVVAPWIFPATEKDPALRLNVWDFGGQEIQHSTHEFFLTERAVYLLVFQPRDDQATAQGLYYWLDLIHLVAPEAPVIVALSKQDEYEGHVNDAGDLKKLHPKLVEFIPVSCVESHAAAKNAPRLRQLVLDTICSEIGHIRYKLPASWIAVKEGLEQRGLDHVSYGDYQRRCVAQGISDPEDQKLLADYLHDLGTMLNYGDRMPLEQTHILNPGWVTEGVYAVVLAKELEAAGGEFDDRLLATLLGEAKHQGRYPADAQKFIREMMLAFKLCYALAGAGPLQRYLVPNALPIKPPGEVDLPEQGVLRFEIRFPRILPTSVMSRFIVAMHSQRAEDRRWRLGLRSAVLGHEYLVTAHPKERCIRIAVDGKGATRVRALEVIRQHFAVICREKEGLGAQEFTFPPGHPEAEAMPFDDLLEAERNREPTIWRPGGIGKVSVTEWLNGVTDPKTRKKIQKAIAETKERGGGGRGSLHITAKTVNIGDITMSKKETKTVTVTARDLTNVNVGIDQLLQDSLKMIQQMPTGEQKELLETLTGQLIPVREEMKVKDAKALDEQLVPFIEEAQKPQEEIDGRALAVSGKGLIEAAQTVGEIAAPVLTTVGLILKFFGVPLP